MSGSGSMPSDAPCARLRAVLTIVAALASAPALAATTPTPGTASYRVRLLSASPPRLGVHAELPCAGRALTMDVERPSGIPELDAHGWPALIAKLHARDADGQELALTSVGEAGWQLAKPCTGRLTLDYEVQFAALAARDWPAPRETAFGDAGHLVWIGRASFITTPKVEASRVVFAAPKGWRPVTPWPRASKSGPGYAIGNLRDLRENLLVLTRSDPEVIAAGGFHVLITPIGHWLPARGEVRRVLGATIPRLVRLMGSTEREDYSVVLLPTLERGGESFRQSFALTFDAAPTPANGAIWGDTLAHEIFHYWNGSRMRGADYATSQWFQEGFTEYAANLALVTSGIETPEQFTQRLAAHLRDYRKLATSLEAGGTHKGPPLYGGGALVAFTWDVLIRQDSGGKRGLGDFLRTLWQRTDRGQRPYAWPDLRAALDASAHLDWDGFYGAHLRGREPLPIATTLAAVGLRLASADDGAPRIEPDPAASTAAQATWRALVTGR